jgi:hypothetical protein
VDESSKRVQAIFDPGWLFLVAGVGLLAATVLIPAWEDLERARWQLGRARAVEAHRGERLRRYEEFLAVLEAGDSTLVLALAERQLNQIPVDRQAVPGAQTVGDEAATVFPALEPPALRLPVEFRPVDSMLARWSRGGPGRLVLLMVGGVCVLIGLMPSSRESVGDEGAAYAEP